MEINVVLPHGIIIRVRKTESFGDREKSAKFL
jgi:hypothetical protein